MDIRLLVEKEIDEMAELYVKSWRATYKGIIPDKILDTITLDRFSKIWKEYITKENNGIFGAFENDIFLGFGAFTPDEEIENTLYLDSLHIKDEYKGKGVGTKIINYLKGYAREKGYKGVSVSIMSGNDRARNLYTKLGAVHLNDYINAVHLNDYINYEIKCEKLYWDIEILGNGKLLDRASKELEGADEQLLVLKIVEQYIKGSKLNSLYQLLTRKETNPKDIIKIGIEAQPLSHREKEGNTYLDLAMGSIKRRGNTESGIELDTNNEEQDFVFCEAKWKSDLSVGVSKCSIRNQLQRVIENALIFAGENFKGNIFVTLITPELYKKHYELGLNTRFYSCKYFEYKGNIRGTFLRELDLIKELGVIPFNDKKGVERKSKYREIVEKNLDKLILNWVTFGELLAEISNDILKNEYEKYNTEE